MTKSVLIAGFGGQGVLFAGKFLAYKGLLENKEISWLPSYGPEMRGGTANCTVIVSDEPVGSPIVANPDILVAMNLPSFDKYEASAKAGGYIFADSTLISKTTTREDVTAFYIPATQMAKDMGIPTLANMIMMGKVIKETGVVSFDEIEQAIAKVVSAKHASMAEINLKALEAGYNY